ncbi:unnamed protein product [Kluyveromyces dobzhanskii CBS 2104]|uniref:WGS project CCBQ000000000 data, contig 00107 n=1 Tax=Kluyveromyces dobzhanskii CBS 2104 TaxID=1427455 RepID=A0A0A8L159_9SACH|nr:unnamed protein product [Kluyveromyces dobzhanskii CBS 2104]
MFSPSAPDLSQNSGELNASEPSFASDEGTLRKNVVRNNGQSHHASPSKRPKSTILRENSGGLSFINLYYDSADKDDDDEAQLQHESEMNSYKVDQSNSDVEQLLQEGGPMRLSARDGSNSNLDDSGSSDALNTAGLLPTPESESRSSQFLGSASLIEDAASNSVKNSHLDRYGFMKQNQYISEKQFNEWWTNYSKYCIRRKRKWKDLLLKSGLPVDNDSPTRFPSKSEKLKRYVRKGIPAEWRGNAWWYFARGDELLSKNIGVYDKLLTKINNPSFASKDTEIIERDLHRTFPDNVHFQKSKDSDEDPLTIKSLRRILKAFAIYNSKIGYCQSMNFLVGLLLLFMDEERAFWMLVIITSRYLPGVHSINLEGVNINQGVLLLCIKEYLPDFWQRIYSNKTHRDSGKINNKNEFLYKLPPVTLCTASWFMSCFIGVVPVETTLRIWDCLFYEGSHILFKMSLAILELSGNNLPKAHHMSNKNADDEDMELFQAIQTFPKQLINPNDIIDKAIFKRRLKFNALNQDEIERCKKYVISQRAKYKNFQEVMKNDTANSSKRDSVLAQDLINETFSNEGYGFKKGLNGVNWNNNIKERVRRLSRKR